MQTETTNRIQKGLVPTYLPWMVVAGALLFYFFTLHRHLSVPSLISLPHIAGWDWQPIYHAPLHYLLTLPIRWLPGSWQMIGLSLFATLCAALSLGLLARSVSLLPHDRTRDQRQFEQSDYSFLSGRFAWAPPVFAVLVCGLQFSFWQHAIVDTAEALDVLLFAYLVRCLLESRVDPRESWLTRAAFVYGLAITNNFAMIGFLPAFLIALVWIKGVRFFDSGLIIQMILWGMAGLSLYFFLPAVNSWQGVTDRTFWEMIRMNIGAQKGALTGFPRYILLLISLTSLLPLLFIGIRWPAQFGDISAAGNALTNLMTHVIHAVFLLACLYVCFDPPYSPRRLGHPYPLLPFYFMGALSVGYFAGYFLLVFSQRPGKAWQQPSIIRRAINYAIVTLVCLAMVAVPVALFVHNRPEIARNNSGALHQYGLATAQSLPPAGAVVLADDVYGLYALGAALAHNGTADKYVLLHTSALSHPAYHRYLLRRHPNRWRPFGYLADRPSSDLVPPREIIDTVVNLSKEHSLYYLHPSFGYFFESFYLQPEKLVYSLHAYATNQVAVPPLTAKQIAVNHEFWKSYYSSHLKDLVDDLSAESGVFVDPLASRIGALYSRQLNFFGVQLQRSGAVDKAGEYFQKALELNSANALAYINNECNQKLRAGVEINVDPSEGALQRLAPYRGTSTYSAINWNLLLRENGPVDEPNSCFILATVLAKGKNHRQSAQQLMRVVELQPDNAHAQVALATAYARAGFPAKGLELVSQLRARPDYQIADVGERLSVLQAEAWAYVKQGNWERAEQLLQKAQQDHPESARAFAALSELYLDAGRITNAIEVFEKQLAAQPGNAAAIVNYSALLIQNKAYAKAARILDPFIQDNPKSIPALQNRAIAHLLAGKFDLAKSDYEALINPSSKPSHSVYYGLGEIAFQQRKFKVALDYYQKYLDVAPNDSPERQFIEQRIKSLKRGDFGS